MNYEIVKNRMTVFVQDVSVATFDPSLAYAVAIAQSYTLDESGDTQEVIDLADCDSDWANPEVSKKNWTLSVDTLLLRPLVTGTTNIGNKFNSYDLKVGDITWVVVGDAPCATPFNPADSSLGYKYGKAVVTSLSQSGTPGEFHTLSATFTGKGELKRETL